MSEFAIPLLAMAVGALGAIVGVALIRGSGANTRAGRRLAGAQGASLRDLHALADRDELPRAAVRVEGRVRCNDPIVTATGERLALLHRDVEILSADDRWRTIERVRDARTIDLWERSASVSLDLPQLAEPLIAIPQVWEGAAEELDGSLQPAVDRVRADHGVPGPARATTRQVLLVDQLIVLAVPARDDDGKLRLDPPPGGFLVTNVDLDVAMRLLAGPHRKRMVAGYAVTMAGIVMLVAGAASAIFTLIV